MVHAAFFVVPGRLETLTGGSIYDRRMVEGLRRRGWSIEVREVDDGFPFPGTAALRQAAGILAAIPNDSVVVVDGLAFGAMPEVVEHERSRLRLASIVHLPLAADIGLDDETIARLERSERRALAVARLVVVTGPTTLALLEHHRLTHSNIVVIEPGTDPPVVGSGFSRTIPGRPGGRPLQLLELLCVATLNRGKGHDVLLRALAGLRDREWHLTCAGSLTRDPATADGVRVLIRDLGLEDRVDLSGELDSGRLEAAYARADVFVLATRRETYGMAVAEALAHGLPVVSTTTGSIPALVGQHAGVVVPPGDVDALRAALARVIDDRDLRCRLADGARQARLPSWDDAAARLATALSTLAR